MADGKRCEEWKRALLYMDCLCAFEHLFDLIYGEISY